MSLTERQRNAIVERDGGRSQIRHYSEEEGWHTGGYCNHSEGCSDLHVHHIRPQRLLRGEDRDMVNAPENLITTYACEHVGVCSKRKIDGGRKYVRGTRFVLHPDTEYAIRTYDGTPRSFDTMTEIREQIVEANHDSSYWDTDHDLEMAETAEERTILAMSRGWHYPSVRGHVREPRKWKREVYGE